MERKIALGASALAVMAVAGMWAVSMFGGSGDDDPFGQCRSSAIAGGSEAFGGPLELVNAKGETVTDKEIFTEPTLLYFGYTYCPDVCPLDVARNAEAVDILQERGISTTPVFISVDPKRDTPEAVGDFAFYMHDKMMGLTGSEEQVAAASKAYRTYYKVHPEEDGFYLVDHSTFTYLVTPEHGFLEFFRRDTPAEDIANKVQCFVEAS